MKLICFVALLVIAAGIRAEDDNPQVNGVRLTYEYEQPADQSLAESLHRRLGNMVPGVRVQLREGQQVDVIIPTRDKQVIELVKRILAADAKLEFLIVANPKDHKKLLELAAEQPGDSVVDGENVVGRWATVEKDGVGKLRVRLDDCVVRDRKTKKIIEDPGDVPDAQILLVVEADGVIGGKQVQSVSAGYDTVGNPCIYFTMTEQGARRLKELSVKYAPDPETGFARAVAIVFDGRVLTAPRLRGVISQRGQITGNFTGKEVRFLTNVLSAGRLPVQLKQPPTETPIEAP